jgi:site-specific recombinase XerD
MDLSRLLRRYYQYLKLEKGFSDNTVAAYMRDHRLNKKGCDP